VIALHRRRLQLALRVVVRMFDGEFAAGISYAYNLTLSQSASHIAVTSFAATALGRPIVATILIARRQLHVVGQVVNADSPLPGR